MKSFLVPDSKRTVNVVPYREKSFQRAASNVNSGLGVCLSRQVARFF
jgi:hypothetical protein